MQRLVIPFEGVELQGDVFSAGDTKPRVLLIHGAGNSSRARYRKLRELLFAQGIGSYAFDLIGHGETGGVLSSSSIERRTKQVMQVIETLAIPQPLTLIGTSMGAYTALKVLEKVPVDTLVFLIPAIYDRDAYRVPFGEQFSEIIRRPKSWENSDAWEILAGFKGKLLVIGAAEDQTVPRELTQKIYDSASRATKKEIYFVPGASHLLMKTLEENQAEMTKVISLIASFCR